MPAEAEFHGRARSTLTICSSASHSRDFARPELLGDLAADVILIPAIEFSGDDPPPILEVPQALLAALLTVGFA